MGGKAWRPAEARCKEDRHGVADTQAAALLLLGSAGHIALQGAAAAAPQAATGSKPTTIMRAALTSSGRTPRAPGSRAGWLSAPRSAARVPARCRFRLHGSNPSNWKRWGGHGWQIAGVTYAAHTNTHDRLRATESGAAASCFTCQPPLPNCRQVPCLLAHLCGNQGPGPVPLQA